MRIVLLGIAVAAVGFSQSWTDLGVNTRIDSVKPQNCSNTGSPSYCNGVSFPYADQQWNVVAAWGGAAVGEISGVPHMFLFGGGHAAYFGNEVYDVNLSAHTATRLTDPSIPPHTGGSPVTTSNISCPGPNADSSPMSIHTYGQIVWMPSTGKMFMWDAAGNNYCGVNPPTYDVWEFDPSARTWTLANNAFSPTKYSSPQLASCALDTSFGVTAHESVVCVMVYGGGRALLRWDAVSNTWTTLRAYGGDFSYNGTLAIDPVRKIGVVIGNTIGGALSITKVDLSNTSYTYTDVTSSTTGCSALQVDYPGVAYDSVTGGGNFMVWPNSGNTVYEFNPTTLACTAHTASGGPPAPAHANAGTAGRFAAFPSLGGFAVVNSTTNDAFLFQIPIAPAVTTLTLPGGSTGVAYSQTIAATGIPAPACSVTSGTVPAGLTLSGCTLSGTPTSVQPYTFTVTASNSAGTASQAYTVPVVVNGMGASTVTCIDQDGDGYGTGAGCTGPDSDDMDVTIHSGPEIITKYGSLSAALAHLGYTPLRIWYVSLAGNDATCISGSAPVGIGSPCLTPAPAISHLQAGDMVLWRAGTYTATAYHIDLTSVNGTSSNPIVFKSYPGEAVVLSNLASYSIRIVDRSWITIDGFTMSNVGGTGTCITGGNSTYGLSANTFHNITIINNESSGCFRLLLFVGYDNILISHNAAHDSGENGIYIGSKGDLLSSSATVTLNLVYKNGWNGFHVNGNNASLNQIQNMAWGNVIGNFDWQRGVHDSTFASNLSISAGNGGLNISNYVSTEGGSTCGPSGNAVCVCPGVFPYNHTNDQGGSCYFAQSNNVIEHNTFYGTALSAMDGVTSTVNVPGIRIQRQASCTTSECIAANINLNTFRNNIVVSYTDAGYPYPPIQFRDGATGWPQASTFDSNVVWQSNAAHGAAVIGYGPVSGSYGFNPYTCATAASVGITLTNCVNADPKFVAADPTWYNAMSSFDLRLAAGSPARQSGAAASAAYDLWGKRLGTAPSMGAMEYQGGAGTPASISGSFTGTIR